MLVVLEPTGIKPTFALKIEQLFKRDGSKPPLCPDQEEQLPHRSPAKHSLARGLRHDRWPKVDRLEGGSSKQ